MRSILFYRNSEKLGSRFNFDFEKLPSKFTKPFWISLSSGNPLMSPRAANDGGDDRNRFATRWISSAVIFSEWEKGNHLISQQQQQNENCKCHDGMHKPIASIKCSGFFRDPVASTCRPISSNTTGLASRFISSTDCNWVLARLSSSEPGTAAIATISRVITLTALCMCCGGADICIQNSPLSEYTWLDAVALYIQWYWFSTFVYSRVYIPLPGPPAEKEPPPPIIKFSTHDATKSGSWCDVPSNPITTWANSGNPTAAYIGISHSSCVEQKKKKSVWMLES